MATAEAPAVESTEEPVATSKLLIIAFVALVVISNVTWGVVFFMTGGQSGGEPAAAAASEGEGSQEAAASNREELGPIVEMKPLVVNLADSGGTRYLRVGVSIELRSEKDRELLDSRMVPLRDAFLSRLSGLRSSEIIESADKDQIRENLLAVAREIVAERAIQRIYFTEFMMQ
jgi:flagellar FliL protein